ncbi:MAG: hypothetical protein IPJ65_26860 [Archangiaceae bacterium]|nr:hypothetical protein [Archangiaceae bacterium]
MPVSTAVPVSVSAAVKALFASVPGPLVFAQVTTPLPSTVTSGTLAPAGSANLGGVGAKTAAVLTWYRRTACSPVASSCTSMRSRASVVPAV